ncbi:extracellular solute-binding protein [Paenibacillus sp. GYB006]|uniref:ABC transporter substrate-binding protein n=1 Tax=Paenibacillus sp. GYB006 TaxID=2994394 RepID=UPI002F96972B
MSIKMKPFLTAMILVFMLVVSACSGGGTSSGGDSAKGTEEQKPGSETVEPKSEENNDPVTLKLYIGTGISDEELSSIIVDPVKAKYPNITIEPVRPDEGKKIEELIAANDVPDIIFTWNGDLGKYSNLDLFEDITPLAEKHGIDLNAFQPSTLDTIRQFSSNNELYALPFNMSFNITFYNKDIFDKFGVDYPTNDMTWDQMIELSKSLTRNENGIQYRGLDSDNLGRMTSQLAASHIDGKTEEASVDNEKWKRIYETAKKVWSIPGNEPPKMMTFDAPNNFATEKNIAILPSASYVLGRLADVDFNWGVVSYPVYTDLPDNHGYTEAGILGLTKTSKHKEQVVQALSVITSKENQQEMVRNQARLSPLNDPELNKQFGADLEHLKDKNIGEMIYEPLQAPYFSSYENDARGVVWDAFKEYYAGKDINTTLREANEKVNALLAEKKAK